MRLSDSLFTFLEFKGSNACKNFAGVLAPEFQNQIALGEAILEDQLTDQISEGKF